jgi:hypothetical protein
LRGSWLSALTGMGGGAGVFAAADQPHRGGSNWAQRSLAALAQHVGAAEEVVAFRRGDEAQGLGIHTSSGNPVGYLLR